MAKVLPLRKFRLSVLLAVVVLLSTAIISYQLYSKERERLEWVSSYAASLTAQQLKNYILERASDLTFLGKNWVPGAGGTGIWMDGGRRVFENHPEYQCVELLDSRTRVVGGFSRNPKGLVRGERVSDKPGRLPYFEMARDRPGQVTLTGKVPLDVGEQGMVFIYPLGGEGAPGGFSFTSITFRKFMEKAMDPQWKDAFETDVGLTVSPPESLSSTPSAAGSSTEVLNQWLTVTMKPRNAQAIVGGSQTYHWVPLLGTGLALLLAFLAWRLEQQESIVQGAYERLRMVVDNSYDIIWSCDDKGLFTFVSPSLHHILGYPPGEMIGQRVADLVHPLDFPRLSEGFGFLRQGGILRNNVMRFKGRNGEIIFLETTVTPTRNPSGWITRLDGASRDVTDRLTAEERYRDLVESSEDLIMTLDGKGSCTFVNRTVKKLFGYEPKEVRGRKLLQCLHPDDRTVVREEIRALLSGQRGLSQGEYRFLTKGGDTRHLELNLRPLMDVQGQVLGMEGVGRDRSSERRLENQILQFQKMEAIGKLAGGMAHDFNNLLTIILASAESAENALKPGTFAWKDLQNIRKAALRAAELTRQVLTFSRKQPIEPRELGLNSVVLDVEKLLKRLLPPNVTLSVVTAQDLHWVMADRVQMEQVIMNLVLNAKDAMPKGGGVRVRTRNVELLEPLAQGPIFLKQGKWVVVEVEDEGTGIPEENVEKIFEPFFTTKETGQGTGLGLSVVYGILRAHQGGIHVYSTRGKGTTIRAFLPAVEHLAKKAEEPVQRPVEAADNAILLVEGEEFNRKVLRRLIEILGYPVLAATGEEEAKSLFEREKDRIQLLMTNAKLEKIKGTDLYQAFRKHRDGLKLVLLSDGNGKANGSGEALSQPYDFDKLASAIDQALKSN